MDDKLTLMFENYLQRVKLLEEVELILMNESVLTPTEDSNKRLSSQIQQLSQTMANMQKEFNLNYKAAPYGVKVQKLSQMRGPAKYIFFIKEIIRWIGDGLVYMLSRIVQFVASLTGTGYNAEVVKHKNMFERETDLIQELEYNIIGEPESVKKLSGLDGAFVRQYTFNGKVSDDGKIMINDETQMISQEDTLNESSQAPTLKTKYDGNKPAEQTDRDAMKLKEKYGRMEENTLITFDVARDVKQLKLMLNAYFNLYDNSFGSFGENLFSVEELSQIYSFYQSAFDSISSALTNDSLFKPKKISLGSIERAFESIQNTINVDKLKRAIALTSENVRNLSINYEMLKNRIKQILNVIVATQATLFSRLEGKYLVMFTAATSNEFNEIIDIFDARIKDLTKQVEQIKQVQNKFVDLLGKFRHTDSAWSALMNNESYAFSVSESNAFEKLKTATTYTLQLSQLRFDVFSKYVDTMIGIRQMISAAAGAIKIQQ